MTTEGKVVVWVGGDMEMGEGGLDRVWKKGGRQYKTGGYS